MWVGYVLNPHIIMAVLDTVIYSGVIQQFFMNKITKIKKKCQILSGACYSMIDFIYQKGETINRKQQDRYNIKEIVTPEIFLTNMKMTVTIYRKIMYKKTCQYWIILMEINKKKSKNISIRKYLAKKEKKKELGALKNDTEFRKNISVTEPKSTKKCSLGHFLLVYHLFQLFKLPMNKLIQLNQPVKYLNAVFSKLFLEALNKSLSNIFIPISVNLTHFVLSKRRAKTLKKFLQILKTSKKIPSTLSEYFSAHVTSSFSPSESCMLPNIISPTGDRRNKLCFQFTKYIYCALIQMEDILLLVIEQNWLLDKAQLQLVENLGIFFLSFFVSEIVSFLFSFSFFNEVQKNLIERHLSSNEIYKGCSSGVGSGRKNEFYKEGNVNMSE
ncbi:hypothetical protein VP01_2277g1 [Puccinia sorghi]|uniref:Uncharacterized protein n=1 Tax=Puccinia sorghi TaxID=27349 RepID=A0A0L6V883_9BASI|nr:hypothetical protein VP01_2277g1 [Puccinia sorghi]